MTTSDPSRAPAPKPGQSFDALPLSPEVRQALRDMKYEQPTPVQAAVFESAASGHDLVVQARTGTGKTTAFGLPLIERTVRRNVRAPQALVLCPTRELALQVSRELEKLGGHKGVTVVAVYGGAPMSRQIDAIAAGAQIVVGTPGRVLDHLRRGTLRAGAVRVLVLDEADEMLSMGFERELTAILEQLPKERQTLLFSATIPPDIERMARTRLRQPEFVILSSDQVGALEVQHHVYSVSQDKPGALVKVLEIEDPDSAIIFCNTREQTENVAHYLKRQGFEADWLNGDLPQSEREQVMLRTREGKLRFLVATDVAARGIDISHLSHVINYDFPLDAELYVHRTGRTGRMGRMGTAISLVTPQEVGALYILRLTYKIRPIEHRLPSAREERTRIEADVVRSLADTFVPRGGDAEHLALARRLLSHDQAEAIIAGMLREQLSSQPELPELSQSRRRGRLPSQVVVAPAPFKAPKEPPRVEAPSVEAPRVEAPPVEAPHVAAPPVEGAPETPRVMEAPFEPPEQRREAADRRRVGVRRTSSTAKEAEAPTPERPSDQTLSDDERDSSPLPEGVEVVELHLDIGRRDGARVRTIKSLLADGGIAPEHVRRVRVRDRYCFIEIDRPLADAAIEALDGQRVGDRNIRASISARSVTES